VRWPCCFYSTTALARSCDFKPRFCGTTHSALNVDVRATTSHVRFGSKADVCDAASAKCQPGNRASLDHHHLVRGSRGLPSGYFISSSAKNGRATIRLKRMNEISTHLVRLIYHRRPTIGMRRPSASSALRFLTHDVIKKTSLCWALYRMYARPIEIVIRPKSYFDFHVSDTYVFASYFDA